MLFKRKDSFFLDLSSDNQSNAKPAAVQVAVREPAKPAAKAKASEAAAATSSAPAAVKAAPVAAPANGGKPMLTTAEAIAAELRVAQEARPAPSKATFAPDCLNPANALPSRRRRPGANLAGFKAMAEGMFRS
jgi:uncharacterized membrane protein YccC